MANEVYTTSETNLIKAAQMARIREVDFVSQFAHNSLAKFLEVLGVTRKIPMMEGTTMYVYSTTGTLQSGAVASRFGKFQRPCESLRESKKPKPA